MNPSHLHTHDPRAELLGIVGILATVAGAALALLLGFIKRPMPDAIGVIALFTMAAVLTVGGIWLTLRRRWAGMLIATTSLLTAADISRCSRVAMTAQLEFCSRILRSELFTARQVR